MNLKLDATTAQAILNRVAAGERQKDLATEFQVSPSAVSNLVSGKSWPQLERPKNIVTRHGSKLSAQDIHTIWVRLMAGETPASIGRDFGVSRQAIANIKKGRAWQDVPKPEPARPARRRVWES